MDNRTSPTPKPQAPHPQTPPAETTSGPGPDPAPDPAALRLLAAAEFRHMMVWIAIIAVLMTVAALVGLSFAMELTTPVVLAVVCGVFFSVMLGSGLFAAAFFSSKSGYDQMVGGSTRPPPSGGDGAS